MEEKKISDEDLNLVARIQEIVDVLGISSNVFAQTVNVSPAAMYQVLKMKRNIPSVNIIKNILKVYPRFNADWLLFGIGQREKKDKPVLQTFSMPGLQDQDLFKNNPVIPQNNDVNIGNDTFASEYPIKNRAKEPEINIQQTKKQEIKTENFTAKKIDKIMIFYNDNTFMSFSPEQ
jgi:transcriptional regulator with XRE-family HTH domain